MEPRDAIDLIYIHVLNIVGGMARYNTIFPMKAYVLEYVLALDNFYNPITPNGNAIYYNWRACVCIQAEEQSVWIYDQTVYLQD